VADTGEWKRGGGTREEATFFVGRGQRHLFGGGGCHRARLEVVSARRLGGKWLRRRGGE